MATITRSLKGIGQNNERGQLKEATGHELRVDSSPKLTVYFMNAIIFNYISKHTGKVPVFSIVSRNVIIPRQKMLGFAGRKYFYNIFFLYSFVSSIQVQWFYELCYTANVIGTYYKFLGTVLTIIAVSLEPTNFEGILFPFNFSMYFQLITYTGSSCPCPSLH